MVLKCLQTLDKCQAGCCRKLYFQISHYPGGFNEFYLLHEGVEIIHKDNNTYVCIPCRCKHLTEDNLCDLGEEGKPDICKQAFSNEENSIIYENGCIFTP